jgi:hypothetical protein
MLRHLVLALASTCALLWALSFAADDVSKASELWSFVLWWFIWFGLWLGIWPTHKHGAESSERRAGEQNAVGFELERAAKTAAAANLPAATPHAPVTASSPKSPPTQPVVLVNQGVQSDQQGRSAPSSPSTASPPVEAGSQAAEDWESKRAPVGTEPVAVHTTKRTETRVRAPTKELDYARNSGQTGFLYAARNPFHRAGLFKLGQTTQSPIERISSLNKESGASPSLGAFELVYAARAADAYGCEQALFARLAHRRLVSSKEFFFLDSQEVQGVLNQAAQSPETGDFYGVICERDADDRYASSIQQLRKQLTFVEGVSEPASEGGGWVLALRNECHADQIVRLMHIQSDPYRAISSLNDGQARRTACVGKFSLVGCWSAPNPRSTVERTLALIGPQRRIQRTQFVRLPREELNVIVHGVIETLVVAAREPGLVAVTRAPGEAALLPPLSPTEKRRPIASRARPLANAPRPSTQPPPPSNAPTFEGFCPCRACLSPVRIAGGEGHVGEIRCSGCRRRVGFAIEGNRLMVWEANK